MGVVVDAPLLAPTAYWRRRSALLLKVPSAFVAELNIPESPSRQTGLGCGFRGGPIMFDPETTALLRAVLDEVCERVSRREIAARTHVASKILEAATNGEFSLDGLRQVGRDALSRAPTMWR